MTKWLETNESLFFKKDDKDDPRLGNLVNTAEKARFVVQAYPDDEGVQNGGGRAGAKAGPDRIRHWLYRMTPSLLHEQISLSDRGNINTSMPLAERHKEAREQVAKNLQQGSKLITLGGGHDYGFPDGAGFMDVYKGQKPLVINLDAHFDVRPHKKEVGKEISSGTPFFRLFEEFGNFDFIEIGIQNQCNSKKHLEWLEKRNAKIIFMDSWLQSGMNLVDYTLQTTGELLLKKRPTFLSVDMDVFSWPYSIGTSQSWPIGLLPEHFYPFYLWVLKRLDVKVLGVYETAPSLENHDGTAKLAAQLIHRFLF